MSTYRTHRCNELREFHVGQEVTLSGWINNHRDHGGVLFIDLRDSFGITQLVSYPESGFKYEVAHLQKENCIKVVGTVKKRGPETVNPRLETGEVEVEIASYEILGRCDPLPFQVFPEDREPEELRLTYRYLDLRRQTMHENILKRTRIISSVRRRMEAMGFTEFQTPILTASSPEGARDYLVPSRLHPGKFYALPQAPQQYKQLLMVAGFDRYFQIAPCFRDEDARANRSPGEFYQIDMEMSFVGQEEVFAVVEELTGGLFTEFSDWKVSSVPFQRIPYAESMLKYGSDKPDLRNPIVIRDVSEAFRGSEFKAFAGAVDSGAVVRALPVGGIAGQPRSFFDKLIEYSQLVGSRGLAYISWTAEGVKSPIAKFLSQERIDAIAEACGVGEGDVVFFVCDKPEKAAEIAGHVRVKLGKDLDLLEKNVFRFCWVVDYPMYERDAHTGEIQFSHNPFSMPQGGLEALNEKDPLEILAYQYDLVCNGEELSSGAIRNHRPDIMYRAFEIGGYDRAEVDAKFSGMISAFRYGAPPHGGIAPGLDRIVMLLADVENLREIVAFPMNQRAQELMMNSPREVSAKQLEELHIGLELPDEEL